jgi:hypothetical protein
MRSARLDDLDLTDSAFVVMVLSGEEARVLQLRRLAPHMSDMVDLPTRTYAGGMGERWINAVMEVVVPLEVEVDAANEAKLDAAVARLDEIALPDDAVGTGALGARRGWRAGQR